MSFISSRIWACRQTARAIFQYKGLFLMALCLAGLALTIPFFLGTLALSLSNPIFDVPTRTEITIFAERSAGQASVEKLSEQVKGYSRRVGFDAEEPAETDVPFVDPETGEVIEPLR